MMHLIYTIEGFNTKLEEADGIYSVYLYNRLSLKPLEKQLIGLPIRIWNPTKKYLAFELDKKLALNGLQVLWTNLNDISSWTKIEFLLYNQNFDYELLYKTRSPLYSINGSSNKLDILPETLLGEIFFI